MSDTAKALAFASSCLDWAAVSTAQDIKGRLIRDGGSNRAFNPDSAPDLQRVLEAFLGNRYFIQVNRGTSSRFHWRVTVGLQDLSIKGARFDNAQAEGEDLWDAIFDACVQAAQMYGQES